MGYRDYPQMVIFLLTMNWTGYKPLQIILWSSFSKYLETPDDGVKSSLEI